MPSMQIVWIATGVAAGLLILLVVVLLFIRRKQSIVEVAKPELAVDLQSIDAIGPEGLANQLFFYGISVRLAVLVVAPKGQGMDLPNVEQLLILIDRITPGMSDVIREHQPLLREWPAQLSVEGFSHAFFHNLEMPGDDGRGTPWSGVVGNFTAGMGSILVGMICVADSPNQLGKEVVKHEGKWREVLKVER